MMKERLLSYKGQDDDSRWILSKEEIEEIESRMNELYPHISWEVRPIYGHGVSLVGKTPTGEAWFRVASNRGLHRAEMEEIEEWAKTASMVLSDNDLAKDILGSSLGLDRVVVCEHCGASVYRLRDGIRVGDPMLASDFKGLNGFPDPVDGSQVVCPNCGDDNLKRAIDKVADATH